MLKKSLAIICLCLAVGSCGNKETDDIAKAQKCLNEVPQSDPTQADACLKYVEKYESQQAYILKCGIVMTSGGLMEDDIVAAYDAIKAGGANKEAIYMDKLALTLPNVSGAYTKAQLANEYCKKTQISGMTFLASAVLMGTSFKYTASLVGAADINSFLAACAVPAPSDPDCQDTAVLNTIGDAVAEVAESYCASASSDESVCNKIESAMSAAGGVASNAGQALYCYLNNRTLNTSVTPPECN